MNAVDIILLLILAFAGYRGYQRGFVVSLLSIIAFVIAVILAFVLLDWGIRILDDLIDGFNGVIPYLSFILIFVGVVIAINVLGKMLKNVIDLTIFGSFDNVVGGMVGVLKWVFGLSLLIWLSQNVGFQIPPDMQESSLLYSKLEPVAPYVVNGFSEYLPFLKSLFHSIAEHISPANP